MLKLLDVNVLLAAHRADHPDFPTARGWLEDVVLKRAPFAVIEIVAGSFVRISGSAGVFTLPTPRKEALEFLRALRMQPSHVEIAPGPSHLELLGAACRGAGAAGDLRPEARIAAVALEHGCEVVSFDREFARFPDVPWSIPGQPAFGRAG